MLRARLSDRWGGGRRTIDAGACLLSAALGALFLSPSLHGGGVPIPTTQLVADVAGGVLASLALWWRRRWPFGVALACVLMGAFSTSGTVAGLLALSSLAVHRHLRPALVVAALFVFIWLRGTLPRLRYDQFMQFGWKMLIPVSLFWIVAVGTIRAISLEGSINRTYLFAAAAVAIVIFIGLSFVPEAQDDDEAADQVDEPTGGYPVPPMPSKETLRG